MRQSLIAGNWKMHGTQSSASALMRAIADYSADINTSEIALFPPYVHLMLCETNLSSSFVRWGAQNVSEFPDGAYTGEISANMLKDLGCHYVIIGHSERRCVFNEQNSQLIKKCEMIINAGMQPILCVGETLSQRENGITLSVVQEQLEVVSILKDNCAAFSQLVIAYEPVWAIGTGKSASAVEAQDVHSTIRTWLFERDAALANKTRILYGGSVKPENAMAYFDMPDIDGALVGGASLNPNDFIQIIRAANK